MTAEKYYEQNSVLVSMSISVVDGKSHSIELMQEYARLKCEELLEIVAEKVEIKTVVIPSGLTIKTCVVDRDSIFNAVDLDNFIYG